MLWIMGQTILGACLGGWLASYIAHRWRKESCLALGLLLLSLTSVISFSREHMNTYWGQPVSLLVSFSGPFCLSSGVFAWLDLKADMFQEEEKLRKYLHLLPLVVYNLVVQSVLMLGVWVVYGPFSEEVITWKLVFQLGVCLALYEIGFYALHQLFHTFPRVFWMHRIHHELVEPVAMGALYAHPIDHILCNLLPAALGFFVLGTGLLAWTLRLWFVAFGVGSAWMHTPFEGNPHMKHHQTGRHPYGFLAILDTVQSRGQQKK